MTWNKFFHSFLATAEATAMIFMIFIGADVLNAALALTQIQTHLVQLVSGWHVAPIWIMVGIVILHILLGCVTEELSIVLLTISPSYLSVA